MRISQVKEFRLSSPADSTRLWAEKAHKFVQGNAYKSEQVVVIPSVSSENRNYIPIDIYAENTVVSNLAFAGYGIEKYMVTLLSCRMHTLWVGAVGGKLKTDYRYSNTICYNTFPVPELNNKDIEVLAKFANNIFKERIVGGATLSLLYDPKKMPESLKKVHEEIDLFVDELYKKAVNTSKQLTTNQERLSILFKLYSQSKEAA